jgi:hypothetical protein
MLGMFPGIPLFNKSVLTVSLFLVLFASYIFIVLLLNPRVILLRISASIYLGGMLSNCIDKMFFLGVRDHLSFTPGIFFNMADVFQWFSLPFLIGSLFYYSKEIWNENCLRKSFFTGAKSQLKISLNLGAILFVNILILGFFYISFLNYIQVGPSIYLQFINTFIWFSLATMFVSFVFVMIYSQRIVGPFNSLIAYIENRKFKQNQIFKIRKGDPLAEIEKIAQLLSEAKDEN